MIIVLPKCKYIVVNGSVSVFFQVGSVFVVGFKNIAISVPYFTLRQKRNVGILKFCF